jgi:hypothetical protein
MAYDQDIRGQLLQWRDNLAGGSGDFSHYPDNRLGQLQSIRDLLGGTGDADQYDASVRGVLTHIRDLLNTGDLSTAQYPNTLYGLWQAIRDFSGGSQSAQSIYEITKIVKDSAGAHYTLPTPVLIESFDNAAQWTAGGGATLSNEAGGLVIAADGTQAPQATKTNVATFDKADGGVLAWRQNHGDDPEYQTCTSVDIRPGVAGTYRGASAVSNPAVSDNNLGDNWQSYNINDISGHPTGVSQVDFRVQIADAAPRADRPRIDMLYRNAAGRPTVLWVFDNAYIGVYNVAFPKFQSLGLKGTLFVSGLVADVVGPPDHLTLAQIKEMYAAGWDVCPNGSSDDAPMNDHASVAEAIADIDSVKAWLISEGMTRGMDCMVYPNGVSRVAGTKVQVAAVTSNGTPVVTMASTANVLAGYKGAGVLVPRSPITTVQSVDNATTLTMSAAIPAGTSAMSFTDTSGPFHTGKLQAALKAAGYKWGRLTANGQRYTRFGLGDQGLLFPAYNIGPTAFPSLATLQTRLNTIVSRGHTICFYTHNIAPGASGIHMDTTMFESFADEMATRVAANTMDVLTLSQFMARDGSASPPA